MIGRPEWFARRKYGGWGYRPKTWQGWLYVVFIVAPIIALSISSLPDDQILALTLPWIAFVVVDGLHIMLTLNRDEREAKIEAVSERNAAWTMMAIAVVGFCYHAYASAMVGEVSIDPFLFAVLIGGALVKTVSNLVLERRAL